MNIRFIASDVDGTILPNGGTISERTKAAIRLCGERGIPFVISSGRNYFTAKQVADLCGLTEGYLIIGNGGAAVDLATGKPYRRWTLPSPDARQLLERFSEYPVRVNVFSPYGMYVCDGGMPAEEEPYPGYHIARNLPERAHRCALTDTYKLEIRTQDLALLEHLRGMAAAEGYSVSSAYRDNLEIMAPGAGKGTAVRWLAGHLGIDCADCMAFGDYTNDLGMLRAVGHPVAVGNAVDEVKAAAEIIAERSENDGVARIIETYVLK